MRVRTTAVVPWLGDLALAAAVAAGLYALSTLVVRWQVPYALFLVVVLAALVGRGWSAWSRRRRCWSRPYARTPTCGRSASPTGPSSMSDAGRTASTSSRATPRTSTGRCARSWHGLVDERLRTAHGFTRASDPDRARAILGPRPVRLPGGGRTDVPVPVVPDVVPVAGTGRAGRDRDEDGGRVANRA